MQIKKIAIILWPANIFFPPWFALHAQRVSHDLCRGTLHEFNYTSGSSSNAAVNNKPTKLEIMQEHLRWCLFILVQHSYSDSIWLLWEGLQFAAIAELYWQLHWHFSNHTLVALLEPHFYWMLCYFCTGYLNQLSRHFDCNNVWN